MTFCHFYLTMARAKAQSRKKSTLCFPNKLAIAALNAAGNYFPAHHLPQCYSQKQIEYAEPLLIL